MKIIPEVLIYCNFCQYFLSSKTSVIIFKVEDNRYIYNLEDDEISQLDLVCPICGRCELWLATFL